ncbi:metallo-beta-lactamase superfamily protein [Saccharata proteae CBS 121410]|uniref:Metallo-beta-lactamase superfamily protein n=1 Tax=Saccharata proteae CBS 121410 TaxID=1314787 RepID=A0A6A5YD55_9PEZI|nr:metallo-beta-lactamase superfamily protein [Saccharata proteae CBS 121410]
MAQNGNTTTNGGTTNYRPPSLDIPPSSTCVEVSILNTTTDMVVPASGFVKPILTGHEFINLPTFSFHIRHPSGKEILFDLGARKDWWNFSPPTLTFLKKVIPALHVPKGVNEILEEGGVKLENISSIVLSHWHWDHTGDPSLFPPTTELIVGPGFKQNFMPGYPTNPNGSLLDTDFANRNVREVSFPPSSPKFGHFEAHDFFGDGSFYILNVPGHAIGHISGLARTTTNPDTFVFMGGDVCHFGGSFRPTPYSPMPDPIPSTVPLDKRRFRLPCPCSMFTACHPNPAQARTQRYYDVTLETGSWYVDPPTAQESIDRLELFDADENVFVCIAHDEGLRDVVEWFPKGSLNRWKEKGWKESGKWGFLNALPVDGKPGEEWLVPGLIKEGKIWKDEGTFLKPDN